MLSFIIVSQKQQQRHNDAVVTVVMKSYRQRENGRKFLNSFFTLSLLFLTMVHGYTYVPYTMTNNNRQKIHSKHPFWITKQQRVSSNVQHLKPNLQRRFFQLHNTHKNNLIDTEHSPPLLKKWHFITSRSNINVRNQRRIPHTTKRRFSKMPFLITEQQQKSAVLLLAHNNNNNNIEMTNDDMIENDDNIYVDDNSATLRAVTFTNIPNSQEPDLFCDFLLEIGACSACVVDADRGTEYEEAIYREPTSITDSTTEDNRYYNNNNSTTTKTTTLIPIWNNCNVTAHFPASIDLDYVMDMVQSIYDESDNDDDTVDDSTTTITTATSTTRSTQYNDYSIEQVPNQDWIVHVQKSWKPIVVANRFILRFPWHTDTDVTKQIQNYTNNEGMTTLKKKNHDYVELKIQGGIAFGTGEHPTTQLCLEWLAETLEIKFQEAKQLTSTDMDRSITVLDYGSGSGILGMSACALAKANNNDNDNNPINVTAVGIDLDVDSCRIANANSIMNQLTMRNYLPPLEETDEHDESKSLLMKAQMNVITQSEKMDNKDPNNSILLPEHLQHYQYDICVANILAGPLVSLAPTLGSKVKPGGVLGLSGILPHQSEMIVSAYTNAGFENVQVKKEWNGWILVTGIKQTTTTI